MITASGTIITDEDKAAMHAVVDEGWITASKINRQFEREFGKLIDVPHVRTTNSGSSANLLAVATMVEAGYWNAGDEIITSACAFPTTVNPLMLYGLVPVFVDAMIPNYNADPSLVQDAVTDKTKGIMLAHSLGNPFHRHIPEIARAYGLKLVEDACDALGGKYGMHNVGTLGDIATCSFFPAHHITMGEGGAVFTSDHKLISLVESIRDWGRDCYCEPGKVNTCGKRFEHQIGELPYGYDHKYTYTRLGYNLKITEIQAALGLSQLRRVDQFVSARRANFEFLHARLRGLESSLILPVATVGTNPSWFGFPITIRASGERQALQEYLVNEGVDTRLIFSGNLTKQPYMAGRNYRIHGELTNCDKIMNDSFWIGVWPGLSQDDLETMCQKLENFFQ